MNIGAITAYGGLAALYNTASSVMTRTVVDKPVLRENSNEIAAGRIKQDYGTTQTHRFDRVEFNAEEIQSERMNTVTEKEFDFTATETSEETGLSPVMIPKEEEKPDFRAISLIKSSAIDPPEPPDPAERAERLQEFNDTIERVRSDKAEFSERINPAPEPGENVPRTAALEQINYGEELNLAPTREDSDIERIEAQYNAVDREVNLSELKGFDPAELTGAERIVERSNINDKVYEAQNQSVTGPKTNPGAEANYAVPNVNGGFNNPAETAGNNDVSAKPVESELHEVAVRMAAIRDKWTKERLDDFSPGEFQRMEQKAEKSATLRTSEDIMEENQSGRLTPAQSLGIETYQRIQNYYTPLNMSNAGLAS